MLWAGAGSPRRAERERMGSWQGSFHEGPALTHVEWGFSSYTWREEQDQKNWFEVQVLKSGRLEFKDRIIG